MAASIPNPNMTTVETSEGELFKISKRLMVASGMLGSSDVDHNEVLVYKTVPSSVMVRILSFMKEKSRGGMWDPSDASLDENITLLKMSESLRYRDLTTVMYKWLGDKIRAQKWDASEVDSDRIIPVIRSLRSSIQK